MATKYVSFFIIFVLISQLLYGHGDLHQVIKELDRKISVSPEDASLFLQRANFYRQHGDFEKAFRDARYAKKIKPDLIGHQLVLARIYGDQKDWYQAKVALDYYIKARPKDATALAYRSEVCVFLEMLDQAESDIQMAIKLHERAPLPLYLRYVGMLTKKNDIDGALAVFIKAEKALGVLPTLFTSKAQMLRNHGRQAEASDVYAFLRKANPNIAFMWWMEESEMWQSQNSIKSRHALIEAKRSWDDLPKRTRKLPHVRKQYQSMLSQLNK